MRDGVLSFLLAITFAFVAQAQTFPIPVLSGDYPDPTILRDGDDFYMTHSPCHYPPGFLIWHSKDLLNWKPINRALAQWSGSAWAPDLVKHEGKYYIYYPAAGSNFVIWTDNIRGKWSEPIDLKIRGIDPGHIVGEDGKRYLFLSNGYVVELTEDGLATAGQSEKVYAGWRYPREWVTECMCLESPKLIKYGDYFYMTSAQGGTAGPATSHMAISARSKSIKGEWENSPYNPIVHTYSDSENWWSKGHGTLIDDASGNWWIVYHAYAKDFHTLGRHTLIEPIEWTEDGWFRLKKSHSGQGWGNPIKQNTEEFLSDNFGDERLGLQWTFWKEFAPESISIAQNTLTLKAKGTTPADARLLLATAADKVYETQVEISLEEGNGAGLILFYNEKAFAGIVADEKSLTVYKDADTNTVIPNPFGNHVFLKIINTGNLCAFLASQDNRTWKILAEKVDVSGMHHNIHKGFYALRIGLLSTGAGAARLADFRYQIPTK
ncbi:MAG: family 43 glycosylhydrolase [Holophagaceae bacterium]|nr:family 43 glycosylhydrolase [Holophagaceae bacterium]